MSTINCQNILHSKIFNDTLRKWQCSNTEIASHNLMYPIFIAEDDNAKEVIPSMPEIHRLGISLLKEHLESLIKLGLESVLLFGVLDKLEKDNRGTNADSAENPVIKAIPLLKKSFPKLTVACDVCLCGYTSHGHCGVLGADKFIDINVTNNRLAEVASNYALAGADIVAPSDMMDGRIRAIKSKLIECNLGSRVNLLSYASKYASCMYGPFRDGAKSVPSFGDRKCYQLPSGSKGLSLLAARRDVSEGSDMLMVKPGLFYLDIVSQTKTNFPEFPLFVYQVSGEYAMLYHAATAGVFDLQTAVMESLISFRRAGADCIITYYTPKILKWLDKSL